LRNAGVMKADAGDVAAEVLRMSAALAAAA